MEKQEINNMSLWDSVCKTDPAITKGAKIGAMSITAISPQHQRKEATKLFGPYGIGWGIEPESEKFSFNNFGDTTLVSYTSIMFYKYNGETGRIPINAVVKIAFVTQSGKGYLKIDDEYTKKVQTNALTKGLSTIGFNSDVFEGKFDDCKYVNQITQEFAQEKQNKDLEEWKLKLISPADNQKLFALTASMDYANELISEYLKKVHKVEVSSQIKNGQYADIVKSITSGNIEKEIEDAKNANS